MVLVGGDLFATVTSLGDVIVRLLAVRGRGTAARLDRGTEHVGKGEA